ADGRLVQAGWDTPDFDASGWSPVNVVPGPGGRLAPTTCDGERVTETIKPVAVNEPEPGVFVYDFGRNMTGWVELSVDGAEPGTEIELRFGEAAYEDGRLNASSNNAAEQTDRYLCRGDGPETWEPRFTYHGFQYVQMTGYPGEPYASALTAKFVRTAVARTGSFSCSHELIERIHRCTLQSQLCNVQMGVPTDDTQRPERLGWGGDAWATAPEAFYNLHMPRVYAKWLWDIRDEQEECGVVGMIAPQAGSGEYLVWSAAFVLIAWWQYVHCGDRGVLEENYPALKRYMAYLQRVGRREVNPLPTSELLDRLLWKCDLEDRLADEAERGHLQMTQWGDHLATTDGYTAWSGYPLSIATAFYYLDVATMARIAGVLGHDEDETAYRDRAESIAEAFHERFFNAAWGHYDTGTQSAQAWPLAFGMVPEEQRERVENGFVGNIRGRQRRLTTGYAATRYAIEALDQAGAQDLIWQLATATDYPSWGYMLSHGRTTSCERWCGEKGSLNHAPLGAAIDEWFYWGLAGIRPDPEAPGYRRIIFRPYLPPDLERAEATLKTVRGTVRSAWQQADGRATWEIEVPANSTAEVHVPTTDAHSVTESDQPVAEVAGIDEVSEGVWQVTSGGWRFEFAVEG
ncbi:MAG: family 78 glycoside hydrolase catalytic domain, partial [Phycisphaeraceae bacterium]|nr:family 78 glycoside hydrolase catalytic domain [Phycisphaeraceae bacterium]